MDRNILVFFWIFLIFLSPASVIAQDQSRQEGGSDGGFWISPGVETAMYSNSGASYGAGLAMAYGRGASIGLKTAYLANRETEIDVMELCLLFRVYFRGGDFNYGPFIQLTGGQALFFRREFGLSIPALWGTISGGAGLGWRFLLGNLFFVEPSIRVGYPYFVGMGLSIGTGF